jgi:hypothetical protein
MAGNHASNEGCEVFRYSWRARLAERCGALHEGT